MTTNTETGSYWQKSPKRALYAPQINENCAIGFERTGLSLSGAIHITPKEAEARLNITVHSVYRKTRMISISQ